MNAARCGIAALAVRVALVGALCAPVACRARQPDPARPDIVLIVVDTLRADHLGCYGYARPTSPRLDALAARGTLFEAAWGAAPWTLPSIMSIMTSRYPSGHRVENDGLRLAEDVPTIAARLRERGYATAGFVSHVYVTAQFGFDRGFEHFEDFGLSRPGYRPEAEMEPAADRVTGAALEWIAAQRGRPVFLFVHYFDPHWPYDPPERIRALFPSGYTGSLDATYDAISRYLDPATALPEDYARFLIDRYDAEIRFTDEQIGRLLDGLAADGRGERTYVVVTGDHGEEFKEHGSMGHGRQLYEEVARVPLIVAAPQKSGRAAAPAAAARVDLPVSGIDIAPTLLDLAAAGPPSPGMRGRSLARFVTAPPGGAQPGGAQPGSAPPPWIDRPLLCETVRLNAFRRAVRRGADKLIHSMDENRSELYDLRADPGERHDRAGERPQERKALLHALFSEADLLSGGWNLRWAGGPGKHGYEGRITTTGIFRSVVPLFSDGGAYILKQGNTLEFNETTGGGESGLSFTTAPYAAPVTFSLSIDGRAHPEQMLLGGRGARPRALPFTMEGDPQDAAAFARPEALGAAAPMFGLWRTRQAAVDQPVVLDDETRARLRSLGYVD